jgi:selenocysteine lyase/cysteine desulfurase
MVSFEVEGKTGAEMQQRLWAMGPVRVRHAGEDNLDYTRLSTHIYDTPDGVDRVVAMVGDLSRA